MRTDHDHPAETYGLESLFTAARAAEPPVPEDLMARVLQQAEALQPKAASAQAKPKPAPKSWTLNLWWILGGSGGLAGLAAAGIAGLAIGFLQPMGLGVADAAAMEETWDLYPAEIDTYAFLLDPEPLLKD